MIGEGYTIQPMCDGDIDTVLDIERRVFPHPWSENFFRLILEDRNNYMVTLKLRGVVIGYGGYHFLKNGAGFSLNGKNYEYVVHIINLAIAPEYQGRGYGSALMDNILADALKRGAEYAYLEVRPSNSRAISLYRKFGFMIVGIIENYYPQEGENALVMGLELF